MKFTYPVNKVRFSDQKWVAGISGDEHLSLFNTETQKTIMCKPGHDGCSVKSGQVDPLGKFVLSTGSDGHCNIYKLEGDSASFVTKVKICDKKVPLDRISDLECQWLQDGETILVPGKNSIGFIQKDDETNEWSITHEESISHNSEITGVMSISNEVLVTYSESDKHAKIWCLNDEGCKMLDDVKLKTPVISMAYDMQSKTLAFMDTECSISFIQKDFETGTMPAAQQVADEVSDDIDLDNIEMDDLESK